MFAVVAKVGTWTRTTADGDDGFRASGPFSASLGFPLATRPLEWLELVITPNVGLISIDPTRLEDERGVASPKEVGEVSRPYTTPHAGFAIGASFAVWRVRINPEVNFVALFRPDHDRPGFFAAYPGVAAFFVY
jgi:hypothetical protein